MDTDFGVLLFGVLKKKDFRVKKMFTSKYTYFSTKKRLKMIFIEQKIWSYTKQFFESGKHA